MTVFQSWGFLGSDYPGVGAGTPIFSYIFRSGAFSFLFKYQKSYTFGSVKICGYFFFFFFFFFFGGGGGGGHYEIGLFFGGGGGGISIHFSAF